MLNNNEYNKTTLFVYIFENNIKTNNQDNVQFKYNKLIASYKSSIFINNHIFKVETIFSSKSKVNNYK